MDGSTELGYKLDGARFVKFDPDMVVLLVWHGGHGLHVYNLEGEEIDYYTVGDCSRAEATYEEVAEAAQDIVNEWQEEIEGRR